MSPNDRKYTKEHEWVKLEDSKSKRAQVGITDYAQSQLGDIVYFDLPKVGASVAQLKKMGEVESVKAVSDLFSPVTGKVLEVNAALAANPELANQDPQGKGWLIKVEIANVKELDNLLSAEAYDAFIKEQP